MREDIKAWRRLALLVLLKRSPGATASELADALRVLCGADGIPEAYWRGMDADTAYGVLRSLESGGLIRRCGGKRNSRAGRDSPGFEVLDPGSVLDEIPLLAPEHDEAPSPPADPEAAKNTVLLVAFDELAGIVARHHRELDAFTDRLRASLHGVGAL